MNEWLIHYVKIYLSVNQYDSEHETSQDLPLQTVLSYFLELVSTVRRE